MREWDVPSGSFDSRYYRRCEHCRKRYHIKFDECGCNICEVCDEPCGKQARCDGCETHCDECGCDGDECECCKECGLDWGCECEDEE